MYKPEQDFQPSQWEIPTAVYCRDCMKRMAEHLPRPSDMLAAYVDGKWTPVER
jgi:hypothetical protein